MTENNSLYLYEIINDVSKQEKCLVNFWKKEYDLTVLYDILLTNLIPSTASMINYLVIINIYYYHR